MNKQNKILLITALIGGAVGVGATLLLAGREEKTGSSRNSIGKVVCRLGEVIETSRGGKALMKEAEKTLHREESVVLSAIDLAAAGIDLWNQLKKAG